jgi:hypothetical protein
MSQQIVINYGAAPNDGTGDPLRTAFIKTDENFDNIWLAGPVGSNVTIANNTISVTDTNGNLVLSPNGIGVIQTNSRLAPLANLTYDIGSSALRYRNIYAAGVTAANAVLGNLSNITVTVANLHVLDGTAGYVLQTDGAGNLTWVAGAGSPGGVNTQVQFNNAGSFGVQTGFTFNKTSNLLSVPGNVSATGNVTGNYFLGNGSQLTGIAASYGNANVVANLAALGTNPISTTGNITGGNILGGANVNATTHTGTTVSVSANITGGNILTAGLISATGNITGAYILGNGSQLTGLPATYGNANVATFLAAYGSNTVSTTGNITGNYFIGDGSQLTGISGNIANITANVISFNTAAGINVAAGQMAWNSSDGTLDIGLSYADVVLQVGQETHYVVRNDTGNIIQNGTAVYCSGVAGGSGRIEASPMTGSTDPVKFLGLTTQDISNGVNGVVTYFGYVRGLDTRGTANTAISVGDETWAVGDQLYVHPTAAGKLTNVEPAAPNVKICVASILIRNQTSGVLFVRPTTNLDMVDLSDVQITTPATNQFLVYAGNRWENTALDISLDTTPTLGGNLAGAGFNVSNVATISATGNITGNYLFGNGSQLTNVTASVPSQTILPTIQDITVVARSAGLFGGGEGGANVTVANTIPVTEYGVIITDGTTSEKYKTGSLGSIPGTVSLTFTTGLNSTQFTVFAYVTSNAGTYYSGSATGTSGICLLSGTQIALSDGTRKAIEDITYTDKMLSWDFDRGCYAETTAVWIKRGETGSQYNLLTFSDGTTLRTFDQHRIFNKQAGAFTYPMTTATPIGTVTVNEHGQEITLTNKQVIVDTIEYYNVITDHHMNLFSDSVLTSCRFNNIYPITDMKFVKDGRTLRTRAEFENVPDRFFYGLRLAEQTTDIETVEWYVNRLLSTEMSTQSELTF